MDINGSIALVTGANRGMGRLFVQQLLERGAAKVYATSRRPAADDIPRAHALTLDVTDPGSVAAAADQARDVTLVVNNAGIATGAGLVDGDLGDLRREMETNYWGALAVVRAFLPSLASAGGGAVLNVCSNLSWRAYPGATGYAVSKAAAWMLTNGLRLDLAGQHTQVTGLYVAAVDTDMMAGWDGPKSDPAAVVRTALDGLEDGALEVVADEVTAASKAALAADPSVLYADDLSLASRP